MSGTPARLRLADPRLGPAVAERVAAVLASGHLTAGEQVRRFEAMVARASCVSHAVATTSGTTALHLALVALDVGRGDEVIAPDFTHPATGTAVLQTGATLRLVDVDPRDFTVKVDDVRAALTARTRVVIAVDSFGLPADHAALRDVCDAAGVALLIDAACSLGARLDGKPVGALGDLATVSFHPRKVVTTGEGGMVLASRVEHADRLRRLRSHGGVADGGRARFVEPGFNYRMSDILAAIGIEQMERLEQIVGTRRRLARILIDLLEGCPGLTVQREPAGRQSSWQSFIVVLDESIDRDRVITALDEAGIESTIGTYAMHCEPAFSQCPHGPGGPPMVSARLAQTTIALPLHPGLRPTDVERIAETLRRTV